MHTYIFIFRINEQITSLHYDLHCPPLKMHGDYEIDGRLIILPVQGKGAYSLITGTFCSNKY